MKQGADTATLAVKAFYTGLHLAIPGVDVSTLFVNPEEDPSESDLLRQCAIEVFGEEISVDLLLINSDSNEYLLPADNSSPDSNPAPESDPTSQSSEHFESSEL
jgi:hypothetical protein